MRTISNLVELTLGIRSKKIKWDATWNLIAWLLEPSESHGLKDAVLTGLTNQVFNQALKECTRVPELNIGSDDIGKSKWPDLTLFFPDRDRPTHIIVMYDVDLRHPGSTRKLINLREYGRIAKRIHPGATIGVVAVTNASQAEDIKHVMEVLKTREELVGVPWHLVPLCTIGEWAKAAQSSNLPLSKFSAFVNDVIEWTGALEGEEHKA